MLTVAQAQELVLQHTVRLPARPLNLSDCNGLVLAEAAVCAEDSPPFAKSMMDGYALRSADASSGLATLRVIEEVLAGQVPSKSLGAGEATRIMTGAPLPEGADTVAMHEKTRSGSRPDLVEIPGPVPPGQNIFDRGAEMRAGETVLSAGTILRPAALGLLAALGRPEASVYPRPSLAVLSTGDELVEPGVTPGPGQIRNSNAPMLVAQMQRLPAVVTYLGIARDTREHLRQLLEDGLPYDVLVITGGVSAGKVDLVPLILGELGVETVFHKVAMKPGKPILFGRRGRTLVFGLPGNPVSCLVGSELFVLPALRKLLGRPQPHVPAPRRASWGREFRIKTDRLTYCPVMLDAADAVLPVHWKGSGDLRSAALANAFAIVPPGEHVFAAGEDVEVLEMR